MSILSIIIIATTKTQEKLLAFVSKQQQKFQLTFLGSGGKKVYQQEKKLFKT